LAERLKLEERKRLAERVFASLDGHSDGTVRLLARTLDLARGRLAVLGQAFDSHADALERGNVSSWLGYRR
jgi:hypothetical protein